MIEHVSDSPTKRTSRSSNPSDGSACVSRLERKMGLAGRFWAKNPEEADLNQYWSRFSFLYANGVCLCVCVCVYIIQNVAMMIDRHPEETFCASVLRNPSCHWTFIPISRCEAGRGLITLRKVFRSDHQCHRQGSE